jgi:serine/threonine protein kinase
VKLIDFGIAKAAGKLSRTQVGSIKGKFGYMSPEQVKGVEVDQRTDIFALGICLWEMLTLKRLFQADNELLVIEKVRHLAVQAPSAMGARCPPELDRVVLKALAKAPDERYRAGQDVYRDLNHVAAGLGLTTRDQIAQYMQRAFPGARPATTTAGTDGNMNARQVREMGAMATQQNEKGGSDLDIFEGLGKKGAAGPAVPSQESRRPRLPPRSRPLHRDPRRASRPRPPAVRTCRPSSRPRPGP